jgi:hypothetical protein
MKLSTTTFLLALTATPTLALKDRPTVDWLNPQDLDTTRAPAFFDQPKARKGGYTYSDELSLSIEGEIDEDGMSIKGSMHAMGDATSVVENTSNGGKRVALTVDSVEVDVSSFMMNMRCDSNNQKNADPDCAELFEIVGQTETVETDANGEVISITTLDGQIIDTQMLTEAANGETMDQKFQANQFAASMHYDKTSQMLKLIPDHAVRPGDSWIDDVEMNSMGTFKGKSYLKGYADYEGSDCAVFYFEGTLHLDISHIAKAIGANDTTLPTKMADAQITNVIFWDVKDKISRWAEANITTSFDIVDPMDPTNATPMHIPVELSVILATDITVRPDHDDPQDQDSNAPDGGAAYVARPASTASSGSSGSGGGFVKDTFLVIFVCSVAVGGFMFYKKQQEGWEFRSHNRPSYEFSPVRPDRPMV